MLKSKKILVNSCGLAIITLWLTACQGSNLSNADVLTDQSPPSNTSTTPYPSASPGCTVISLENTPGPTEISLFTEVSDADRTRGNPEAKVTFVNYCDFQSPFCAALAYVFAQLELEFGEDFRLIYRHFPLLNQHDKSALATQAVEAAGLQDAFWQMYDQLYGRQSEWVSLSLDDFQTWLDGRADEVGLDIDQWHADITGEDIQSRVQSAWEEALSLGLPGTPFILLNGVIYEGPRDYDSLASIIRLTLLESRHFHDCPPRVIDPDKEYTVTLHTERGDITIVLYPQEAPLAVNSFVYLAKQGWYDSNPFFMVKPNYIAQAGDPSGTGFGTPGYLFDVEIAQNLRFDGPGIVALNNNGPTSNGSIFFITFSAQPQMEGRYTIIGRVIQGLDVLERLTTRDPVPGVVTEPADLLLSVSVDES